MVGIYFASIFSLLEVVLATLNSKDEKRTCVCVCIYTKWFNPANCLKKKKQQNFNSKKDKQSN